jgi:hypothetical protein
MLAGLAARARVRSLARRGGRFPFLFWDLHHYITPYARLAAQSMPRLGKRLAIKQVLLLELDLGQIFATMLDFNSTGGTGGVAAAIMIQGET